MNKKLTRRAVMAGAAVVVVGALAVEGPRLLRKRHAPSPYDDLLALLDDRDAGAQIGEAVLAGQKTFNAAATAATARHRLKGQKLADLSVAEAEHGQVVEISGWVIPETLSMLYALAAKAG